MRVSVMVVVILTLGAVLGVLFLWHPGKIAPPPSASALENGPMDDVVVVTPNELIEAHRQSTGIEKNNVPKRGKAASNGAADNVASELPESARRTKEILNGLMRSNPGQAQLTAEQAEAVNANVREMIAQGSAAVPAIREFLDLNTDLTFAEEKGSWSLKYNSLRSALFEGLRQIGGPEATEALRRVLGTTAEPGEIAQIARHLESLAPGEHHQEIVEAARETFAMAAKGQAGIRDTAPVFQVLQKLNDPSVIPVLEEAAPQFRYYSALSLAELPEGEGVPALIRMADSNGQSRSNLNDFALLALSQISDQNAEARNALVATAQTGTISDNLWRLLGRSLAGEQMQIGQPLQPLAVADSPQTGNRVRGAITYHNYLNKQNF